MGRKQEGRPVSSFVLFYHLVVLFYSDGCSAADNRATGFTATASGVPSARTVVCAAGGTDRVVTVEETIPHNESSFSSFTLKCRGAGLKVLPETAGDSAPLVCTDSSTINSCAQISLEALHIAALVESAVTGDEKSVHWKIYAHGFPRAPQKLKVGCVVPSVARTEDLQESPEGRIRARADDRAGNAGCLVTVLVRQAPPIVENNVVECTYAKSRTVTPVVSVTPKTPFVGIRCGTEALFVPPYGRYCLNEKLEKCTPRSLGNIFPQYSDSWWEMDSDGRVLTIPVDQLPTNRKKLFFGCVLAGQTVESEKKEDYYCVVPVLFRSAAQRQWKPWTLKDSAGWWLTLLLSLSSLSLIQGT